VLRACDTLANRSLAQLLDPLGKTTPPALTYLGECRGASILKAHQRLWDGGEICPVAAIKCTRHNLLQPPALVHETGHMGAAIVGWNDERAAALAQGLQRQGASADLADIWAGWASEIAADAFSLAHTGFASVAALHDVLDGDSALVFRHLRRDPHPISYVRVLLGVQMCRYFYGEGRGTHWHGPAPTGSKAHRPRRARSCKTRSRFWARWFVLRSTRRCARSRGARLRAIVMPERVSPASLNELGARLGNALFTSAHWLWTEPLRIVGLTGLQLAVKPQESEPILELQRQSMLRLGGALQTV
jgi:hypothetical protein